jgi:hypothetical protein
MFLKPEPAPKAQRTIEQRFPDSERTEEIAQKATFLIDPIVPSETKTSFKELEKMCQSPTRKSVVLSAQSPCAEPRAPSRRQTKAGGLMLHDPFADVGNASPRILKEERQGENGRKSFIRKRKEKDFPDPGDSHSSPTTHLSRKKLPRGVTFSREVPANEEEGSTQSRPKLPRGVTFNSKLLTSNIDSSKDAAPNPISRRLPREATFGNGEPVALTGYPGRKKIPKDKGIDPGKIVPQSGYPGRTKIPKDSDSVASPKLPRGKSLLNVKL